jgi:hypothetical protein
MTLASAAFARESGASSTTSSEVRRSIFWSRRCFAPLGTARHASSSSPSRARIAGQSNSSSRSLQAIERVQRVQPAGVRTASSSAGEALGFNPNANPTTQTLACPGTGTLPGTYGLVLRPPTAVQADGCAATTPITRLLAPQVNMALVQAGTSHGLSIAAGDRLRVRLACPNTGCNAEVQITARAAMNSPTVLVFPQSGFQIVSGPGVVDVDVALPASLIGATTRLVFIARAGGANANPDVLFENPHLVP